MKGILPAAMAAGILLWLWDRFAPAKLASVGAAIAFGGGALVGQLIQGELRLISGESPWNWLPWAALIGLLAGVVLRGFKSPYVAPVILVILLSALFVWFIPSQTFKEAPWFVALTAYLAFRLWVVLSWRSNPPGPETAASWSMSFLTCAMVFVYAGSARLMDTSIVLFGTCAGIVLVAWWKRLRIEKMVGAPAILLPALGLMAQQETFSEVPWPAFFLPALAPLVLAVTWRVPPWSEKRRRIAGLALAAVPLITAALLAMQAGPLELD